MNARCWNTYTMPFEHLYNGKNTTIINLNLRTHAELGTDASKLRFSEKETTLPLADIARRVKLFTYTKNKELDRITQEVGPSVSYMRWCACIIRSYVNEYIRTIKSWMRRMKRQYGNCVNRSFKVIPVYGTQFTHRNIMNESPAAGRLHLVDVMELAADLTPGE